MSKPVPTPGQICAAAASGARRNALAGAPAPSARVPVIPLAAASGIGALKDAEGRVLGVFVRAELAEQTRRFLG